MGKTGLRRSRAGIASILLALGLVACVYVPPHGGPPVSAPPPSYYDYDYYYYPSVSTYFHIYSGYYYYPHGTVWTRTRTLPPHIHIDTRDRVHIRVDGDKPYHHYPEHRDKYKPQPHYRPDTHRDRDEREHNKRSHDRR